MSRCILGGVMLFNTQLLLADREEKYRRGGVHGACGTL